MPDTSVVSAGTLLTAVESVPEINQTASKVTKTPNKVICTFFVEAIVVSPR